MFPFVILLSQHQLLPLNLIIYFFFLNDDFAANVLKLCGEIWFFSECLRKKSPKYAIVQVLRFEIKFCLNCFNQIKF